MKNLKYLAPLVLAMLIFGMACTRVGSKVEEPSLSDIDGSHVDLSGKITVINVWATWCGTCIREMPQLNRLYEKYKDDEDIQFVAFADEEVMQIEQALSRWNFSYRQVADARPFTRSLKSGLVKTYPQNIILDKNCRVVFEQTDGSSDIFAALDEKIKELKQK